MLDIFECYHGPVDYSVYDVSVTTETKKAGTKETDTFVKPIVRQCNVWKKKKQKKETKTDLPYLIFLNMK